MTSPKIEIELDHDPKIPDFDPHDPKIDPISMNIVRIKSIIGTKKHQFLLEVDTLAKKTMALTPYFDKFDCHKGDQGNGFRSFDTMMTMFFQLMFRTFFIQGILTKDITRFSYATRIFTRMAIYMETYGKIMVDDLNKRGESAIACPFKMMELQDLSSELLLSVGEEELVPFYGSLQSFYMDNGVKFTQRTMVRLAVQNMLRRYQHNCCISCLECCLCCTNQTQRLLVKHHLITSVDELRYLWNIMESGMTRLYIKTIFLFQGANLIFYVKRQKRYTIFEGKVTDNHSEQERTMSRNRTWSTVKSMRSTKGSMRSRAHIKCRLVRQSVNHKEDRLIVHFHGGGFFAMSSKSHEVYNRLWAKETGIPVLVPDYSLAPESPYPIMNQDCLDVVLFLMTETEKNVRKMIGFYPKKIIFSGDSAGGYLCLSTAFVLKQIMKMGNSRVRLPHAIYTQYPCVSTFDQPGASRAFATIDSVITLSVIFLASAAVMGPDVLGEIDDTFYRDEKKLKNAALTSNGMKQDRIYNTWSNNFDDLKDVPLYVACCEFDPLLDDGVRLARVWKGPAEFTLWKGVPHGILMAYGTSRSTDHQKMAAEKIIQIFKKIT